jgi:hypothetical protein
MSARPRRQRRDEGPACAAARAFSTPVIEQRTGETTLTVTACRRFRIAYPIAALTLAFLVPAPARADFFDDARRTFTNDIPHFFQDDIPCAFGGQPTSHTRTSCKSPAAPAKHASDGDRDRTTVRSNDSKATWDVPPSSSR